MLRVGIDAWGISGDLLHSGFGQYTALLLRHLPATGPGLELVAYGGPQEPRPVWLPEGVEWRALGSGARPRWAALESRLRRLPAAARADRLDLFHSPAVHVRPSYPPVARPGIPVVATVHDLIPLSFYGSDLPLRLRVFYRWNLRRALTSDAVVTVSEAARAEIVSGGRAAGVRRMTVIPNGVEFEPNPDPEPLRRLGVEAPYLLFAGSYEPRKDLAGALATFEILAGRGFGHQLVAVVERSSGHAAALRRRIETSGLANRVRLVHSLTEPDLRALYARADLLLFPSQAEGFGYPALQAAACGVPVVASDLPALRETMDGAAELAPPGDPAAFAAAAERVLRDPGLRDRLVAAGRKRARLFGVARCVGAHRELYEALVKGR